MFLSALHAPASAADAGIVEAIKGLPGDSSGDAQVRVKSLVAKGPDCVAQLIEIAGGNDIAMRAKAEYALGGIAFYVARPDGAADQAMFTQAMIAGLNAQKSPEVRKFIIAQLQIGGDRKAAPALAGCLLDAELSESAALAMQTLGGPEAGDLFRKALPKAQGNQRLTIIRALGAMRVKEAAGDIRPLLSDGEADIRTTASYALANMGDVSVMDALLKLASGGERYEQAAHIRACLLLSKRLAEGGKNGAESAGILETLWKSETTVTTRQARIEALHGIAGAKGGEAIPLLIQALKDADYQVRAAAAEIIAKQQVGDIAKKLSAALEVAGVEQKKLIAFVFGARGDKSASAALRNLIADPDAGVRIEAATALRKIEANDAVADLITLLGDPDASVRASARENLMVIPDKGTTESFAAAVPKSPPVAKAALLEMLTQRAAKNKADLFAGQLSDGDASVRIAALKGLRQLTDGRHLPALISALLKARDKEEIKAASDAVCAVASAIPDEKARVTALLQESEKADAQGRAVIISLMNRIGGAPALDAALKSAGGADAGVKDAAVRTLSEWPDGSPAAELLKIAGATDNMPHHVVALRGCIRMAGMPGLTRSARLAMYRNALNAAKRPEEKKQVLGGLSGVNKIAALKLALRSLDDEALRGEASQTAIRLSQSLMRDYPTHAKAAIAKVLSVSKDPALTAEAAKFLDRGIAAGKPATASRTDNGMGPERAADGNCDNAGHHWDGGPAPQWLQIDLEKPTKIGAVNVFPYWDGSRYYQYTVAISADGKEWKQVADMSGNTKPADDKGFIHEFDPVEARYVRVNVTKNSANPSVHLVEVKVLSPDKPQISDEYRTFLDKWLAEPDEPALIDLLADNMKATTGLPAGWEFKDGVLSIVGPGDYVWSRDCYDDFTMELEFRLTPGGNSGVFFRTETPHDPVGRGIEIQIYDTYELKEMVKNSCGALYDCVAPSKNALKKTGEWNKMVLTCDDSMVRVELNGELIVDADLNRWTEAGKNPDGTHNKFPVAFKDKARAGLVGLQNHGASRVSFRNVKIRPMD